jgi:hypothetical protein
VQFPLYAPQGDTEAYKRTDLERTTFLAAVSMKLMERTFSLYAPFVGGADPEFFEGLNKRTEYRGAD